MQSGGKGEGRSAFSVWCWRPAVGLWPEGGGGGNANGSCPEKISREGSLLHSRHVVACGGVRLGCSTWEPPCPPPDFPVPGCTPPFPTKATELTQQNKGGGQNRGGGTDDKAKPVPPSPCGRLIPSSAAAPQRPRPRHAS